MPNKKRFAAKPRIPLVNYKSKYAAMKWLFLCGILGIASFSFAQMPGILDPRQQAEVRDTWLKERFQTILPEIMRREGIDMWLLIAREYNEDPVMRTMLPATWLSARRTTMLVIFEKDGKLETLACARYDIGEIFKKA